MYRERSNGDSKLVKAMRKCQRAHPPTATSYTRIHPSPPACTNLRVVPVRVLHVAEKLRALL